MVIHKVSNLSKNRVLGTRVSLGIGMKVLKPIARFKKVGWGQKQRCCGRKIKTNHEVL
jgi:hypothetical protein